MNRREFVASTALAAVVASDATAVADACVPVRNPDLGSCLWIGFDYPAAAGALVPMTCVTSVRGAGGGSLRECYWHYMDYVLPDWRRQSKLPENTTLRAAIQKGMSEAASNNLTLSRDNLTQSESLQALAYTISRMMFYEKCSVLFCRCDANGVFWQQHFDARFTVDAVRTEEHILNQDLFKPNAMERVSARFLEKSRKAL